jgi:hypothetical protein
MMQQETVPQILLRTALRFQKIKDLSSPQIQELMSLNEVEFQQRLEEIRSEDDSLITSIPQVVSPVKSAKKRTKSSHLQQ